MPANHEEANEKDADTSMDNSVTECAWCYCKVNKEATR